MKLGRLALTKNLHGRRVLVRVDWNVPLSGTIEPEASLKLERSLPLLRDLSARGAIVIILTHLGRPKKSEPALSTKHLVSLMYKRTRLVLAFHAESVSDAAARRALLQKLETAKFGSLHLLENVRFEAGEEKNLLSLSKAYASLGEIFVNDAFASCHRAHASVVGIAKQLPSFAGPALVEEVGALSALLKRSKRGFVAVIGGKKLSTKLPVVRALLDMCETVMLGGAMVHPCFVARGLSVGKSYLESEALAQAKKLVRAANLVLPQDVIVATSVKRDASLRCVDARAVGRRDIIVDAGYRTLQDWGACLQRAKTIVWNGPIGVHEIEAMGAGSRFLARVIGARAKGPALGVAGGGDTIPVILSTRTQDGFDFVSTGGGALLEFLVKRGKLPGLVALVK